MDQTRIMDHSRIRRVLILAAIVLISVGIGIEIGNGLWLVRNGVKSGHVGETVRKDAAHSSHVANNPRSIATLLAKEFSQDDFRSMCSFVVPKERRLCEKDELENPLIETLVAKLQLVRIKVGNVVTGGNRAVVIFSGDLCGFASSTSSKAVKSSKTVQSSRTTLVTKPTCKPLPRIVPPRTSRAFNVLYKRAVHSAKTQMLAFVKRSGRWYLEYN